MSLKPIFPVPLLLAVLVLSLAAGWALARQPDDGLPILRKAPVQAADPGPKATEYQGAAPGQNDPLARSYETAPPMIPHAVDDYLPITTRNECLNCHLNPAKAITEKRVTALPRSHFQDREGKDRAGALKSVGDIYFGFYNCSMCHAPQANAPALVDNLQRR